MKRKQLNYLDFIPKRNPSVRHMPDPDNEPNIMLEIENRGFMNRLTQKLFGKPKYSYIHLDRIGTFIWERIDGKKSIGELAELLKQGMGEEAEPLYPRIVKYFKIIKSYNFVEFTNR